jgi:hypothetical protein
MSKQAQLRLLARAESTKTAQEARAKQDAQGGSEFDMTNMFGEGIGSAHMDDIHVLLDFLDSYCDNDAKKGEEFVDLAGQIMDLIDTNTDVKIFKTILKEQAKKDLKDIVVVEGVEVQGFKPGVKVVIGGDDNKFKESNEVVSQGEGYGSFILKKPLQFNHEAFEPIRTDGMAGEEEAKPTGTESNTKIELGK